MDERDPCLHRADHPAGFTSRQADHESPEGKRASPGAGESRREGAGGPEARLEGKHFTCITILSQGKWHLRGSVNWGACILTLQGVASLALGVDTQLD